MFIFENSIYILFCTLFIITALSFIISEYDIMNPAVTLSFTMSFSAFLAMVNINKWNLYMNIDSSLILISAVFVFVITVFTCDLKLNSYHKLQGNTISLFDTSYKILNLKLGICSVLMVLMAYVAFCDVYNVSLMLGNTQGYNGMIHTVRMGIEHNDIRAHFSRWHNYQNIIATCIAYCSGFVFCINLIQNTYKSIFSYLKYLIPVVLLIPFIILSTGRLPMLQLFLYLLIVASILYQRKNKFSTKSKLKIIIVVSIFGAFFFLAFLALGFFTGKVSFGGRGAFEILAHYGGLSMPAFSIFFNDNVRSENILIGSTTLRGIYRNLQALGINIPAVVAFLPFVKFSNISSITTNVYTAYMRYIVDYGYIGMYLIVTFLGLLYATLYYYVRVIAKRPIWIIYYGILILPMYFSINEEIFFAFLFNTSTVYEFILLFVFDKILITRDTIN